MQSPTPHNSGVLQPIGIAAAKFGLHCAGPEMTCDNREITMKNIDKLSALYRTGKIDRRTFMQGAIAAGVTISAASTLAVRAEAATPQKGGILKFGIGHGSTTDSLDPGTFENG